MATVFDSGGVSGVIWNPDFVQLFCALGQVINICTLVCLLVKKEGNSTYSR